VVDFTNVSEAVGSACTVTLDWFEVTVWSWGSLAEAVAVLVTEPVSTSPWVVV
jgi:hypothetical protein